MTQPASSLGKDGIAPGLGLASVAADAGVAADLQNPIRWVAGQVDDLVLRHAGHGRTRNRMGEPVAGFEGSSCAWGLSVQCRQDAMSVDLAADAALTSGDGSSHSDTGPNGGWRRVRGAPTLSPQMRLVGALLRRVSGQRVEGRAHSHG
jgi:hypothetical protein